MENTPWGNGCPIMGLGNPRVELVDELSQVPWPRLCVAMLIPEERPIMPTQNRGHGTPSWDAKRCLRFDYLIITKEALSPSGTGHFGNELEKKFGPLPPSMERVLSSRNAGSRVWSRSLRAYPRRRRRRSICPISAVARLECAPSAAYPLSPRR